jgi:di/tricarboxylate transporter|tara:strand:+ start:3313 stop:5100 length:1788 start_codon:yes stop_codon:yes gene_type:complete
MDLFLISNQMQVAGILIILLGLLIWGRWRYDGIVLVTLAIMVILDLIPAKDAFSGFGHPAVITVALVLLISKALEKSGFINLIGDYLHQRVATQAQFMVVILITAAFLSSFMNNIGAMAMLLPITIGIAQKKEWNPSKFLMPLAFASILGGMNTKIGTPPNIIISGIREEIPGEAAFNFFDFAFAGLPVTIAGIFFISFFGWRLVRQRAGSSSSRPLIDLQDYLVEMTINDDSTLVGKRIHELTGNLGSDTVFMGLVSDKGRIRKPHNFETFDSNQILVLKISPDDAASAQMEFGLSIDPDFKNNIVEGELGEIEAMITPRSRLVGRKFNYFKRMAGGDLSLLGLWRQGSKFRRRLARELFKSGDVMLLSTRSSNERAAERLELLGLMPLWQRELDVIRDTSKVYQALGIFVFSLILIVTGVLDIIVAFLLCVLAFAATRLLTGEGIYRHIEWPIVVMLGAMIPIGQALTTSGLTDTLASLLSANFSNLDVMWILVIILVVTMFVSDLINNAATAVIMAPLSMTLANQLNHPVEPFLMAVAVGASCAFLSPIGHQCNTLVMGPGNYKFGDYWRLGLPLEILITIVSIPAIMMVWF